MVHHVMLWNRSSKTNNLSLLFSFVVFQPSWILCEHVQECDTHWSQIPSGNLLSELYILAILVMWWVLMLSLNLWNVNNMWNVFGYSTPQYLKFVHPKWEMYGNSIVQHFGCQNSSYCSINIDLMLVTSLPFDWDCRVEKAFRECSDVLVWGQRFYKSCIWQCFQETSWKQFLSTWDQIVSFKGERDTNRFASLFLN